MWEDRISRLVLVFAVHFIVSTANHNKDDVSDRHLDIGVIDSSLSLSEPAVMKIELNSHDAEQIKNSEVAEIQITRKVPVPVPVPVEKRVPFAVPVPVDQPFPVYIPKPVPFAVHKPFPYHVNVPVPKPYITEENIVHKHTPVQPPPITISPPLEFLKKIVKTIKNKLNLHTKSAFHGPPPKPIIKHVPVHIPVEKIVPVPVEVKVPLPVKVKEHAPVNFPSTTDHYHFPSTNNEILPNENTVASHLSTVNHFPNHESTHEYYPPEAHKSSPDASDMAQAQQYFNHVFNHQLHLQHQPYSLSQSVPKFVSLPDMTGAKFHQIQNPTNQISNHHNSYHQQSELMHLQNYASTNTVHPHYIVDPSQDLPNPSSHFEHHQHRLIDSPEHLHHQSHLIRQHEPFHQNSEASIHISHPFYIQEPTQHPRSNFVPPQSYHYQSNGGTLQHQEQSVVPSYEMKYVSLPHVSFIDANNSHYDSQHEASSRYVYNQNIYSFPQMSHANQSGWVPLKPLHYPRTFSSKPGRRQAHYHIKMPSYNAKSNRHFGHPIQQYHYNYFQPVTKPNVHEQTKRQFGGQGSAEGPDVSVSASDKVHYNVFLPNQNQVKTYDIKPVGPYRSFNKSFEVKHDDGFYPSGPSTNFMKSNEENIVQNQNFAGDANQTVKVKLPDNEDKNFKDSQRVKGPVPNIVQANLSSIDPFQYIRYAPAVKPFRQHNYTISAPTPPPASTTTGKTFLKSEYYFVDALRYTKAIHPSPQP